MGMRACGRKPLGSGCVQIIVVKLLLWILILLICWPVALLALVLYPIVWVLSIPFRLVGIAVESVFELLRALLFLPARLAGARR